MKLLRLSSTIFYSLNSTGTFTTKLSSQRFIEHSAHYLQMGYVLRRSPGVFISSRIFSSPAHSILCSGTGGGGNEEDQASKAAIPVRAFFFSTRVNLRTLVEQHKQNFILPSFPMTNYVVLGFGNLKPENGLGANMSDCCYMVVFQYGSIVLFNILDHEVDGYLKIVERHASGLLPKMRKDEYELREKPTLNTLVQRGSVYIMLQYLNIERIRIIGSVLSQSIALDYYVHRVDEVVAEFSDITRGLGETGTLKMEERKIFQLIGKANSNLSNIILMLGLFARSDIAWKDDEYAKIWEYLRDEFDLTQRFADLNFKFQYVEHNICFVLDILRRKAGFMGNIMIIILVARVVIPTCGFYQNPDTSL